MTDRRYNRELHRLETNACVKKYLDYCQAQVTAKLIEDTADAAKWERNVREAKPPRGLWAILKSAWKDFRWRKKTA